MTQQSAASTHHNTHASGREKLKAHLAVLLFSLLVSGSFSFGGIATRLIDPIALQALRYAVTVAVIALLCWKLGVRLALPREPWRFVILGLLMALASVLGFLLATLVMALAFLSLALLFAWLARRRIRDLSFPDGDEA